MESFYQHQHRQAGHHAFQSQDQQKLYPVAANHPQEEVEAALGQSQRYGVRPSNQEREP